MVIDTSEPKNEPPLVEVTYARCALFNFTRTPDGQLLDGAGHPVIVIPRRA